MSLLNRLLTSGKRRYPPGAILHYDAKYPLAERARGAHTFNYSLGSPQWQLNADGTYTDVAPVGNVKPAVDWFGGEPWLRSCGQVTSIALSSPGLYNATLTGGKLSPTATTSVHFGRLTPTLTIATKYFFSIVAKADSVRYLKIVQYDKYQNFDLLAGVPTSGSSLTDISMEALGSGYFRCSGFVTPSNIAAISALLSPNGTANFDDAYLGDPSSGIIIRDWFVAISSYPLPYVPPGVTQPPSNGTVSNGSWFSLPDGSELWSALDGEPDGVAYKVQGTGDVAAYEYRRTNSTTSVLIATYPSKAAVDRVEAQADHTTSAISPVLSVFSESPLSEDNSEGLAWGIVDSDSQVALGVTESGGLYTSSGTEEILNENSLDLEYGIVDQGGNLVFGVRMDGAIGTATGWEEVLSDDNSEDYRWAVVDAAGNVAIGITSTGDVVIPGQEVGSGSLFVDAGDIYLVAGGNTTRLTTTGDNLAPRFVPGGAVRFVSDRRRDVRAEYDVDSDGTDTRRFYDQAMAYEHIIVTGQSLARGGDLNTVTNTPPYPLNAFTFADGPVGVDAEVVGSGLMALVEENRETVCSGFAKHILDVALDRKLILSGQGYGGATYNQIKKGVPLLGDVPGP